MHLLLLWRLMSIMQLPAEKQGDMAALQISASEHKTAVGNSIRELLGKLLETEVPLTPDSTDFEDEVALHATTVKVQYCLRSIPPQSRYSTHGGATDTRQHGF